MNTEVGDDCPCEERREKETKGKTEKKYVEDSCICILWIAFVRVMCLDETMVCGAYLVGMLCG